MFERYQDPRETLLHKLEAGVDREPTFGPLSLRREDRTIHIEENSAKLTSFEYQILWILVRAQGGMVSQSEIERFLYEERPEDEDLPLSNSVQQLVTRIRKKLESLSAGTIGVSSIYKQGYFLDLGQKKDRE